MLRSHLMAGLLWDYFKLVGRTLCVIYLLVKAGCSLRLSEKLLQAFSCMCVSSDSLEAKK